MLPFDNKSEFQVIVDMPNGTTLEETARVTQLLAEETQKQREVVNVQTYVGTASPIQLQWTGASLLHAPRAECGRYPGESATQRRPRTCRATRSRKQVRQRIEPLAIRYGARIKVAEVPPGPPVLETLVAEVYGPRPRAPDRTWRGRSAICFNRLRASSMWIGMWKTIRRKCSMRIDEEKAALNGISEDDIARAMQVASAGQAAGLLHQDAEKEDVPLTVRLDRATPLRSGPNAGA